MDPGLGTRPRRDGPPQCYRPHKEDPLPNEGYMKVTALQQLHETYTNFNQYRQKHERRFCDVIIQCHQKKFYCHRVILAASSPYFDAMFKNGMIECHQQEINLPDLDGAMLSLIIDFIYTAQITVTVDNIQPLMNTAVYLKMPHVIEACTTFLEQQLHPSNCIGIKQFAEQYGCVDLKNRADNFLRRRFCEVYMQDEFLNLSFDDLKAIISNEKLTVKCEAEVYKAVMKWISHDITERGRYFSCFLKLVRLSNIDPRFICEQLRFCDILAQMPNECINKLSTMLEALKTHSAPNECPRKPCESVVVYSIGGFRTDSPIREDLPVVEYFDACHKLWKRVADLHHPRSGVAACAIEGSLYVVGGRCIRNGIRHEVMDVNIVECYNNELNIWTDGPAMSHGRNRCAISVLDDKLYVCGGANLQTILNSVECFNPTTGVWTEVASMQHSRMAAGCAVINRFLYVVGGVSGRMRTNTMEKYDPEQNLWELCPPMSVPRSGAAVCGQGKYIYVAGGFDGTQQLSSVERFDTEKNEWEEVSALRTPRSAANLISIENNLFILGGCSANVQYVLNIDKYNPETGSWEQVAEMPAGRSGQGIALGPAPVLEEHMDAVTEPL